MTKCAELANLIGNINAGGGTANKNAIINGSMNVSQRGTSFADPSNDTLTLDRFIARKSNDGTVTITQDSSGPSGFANSLKVDVTGADGSIGSSQFSMIQHKIEAQNLQGLAFGTSDAKNFTLSFYVKSNKTGTYAVNITQPDNSSKQATLNYTINSANTWERKSLTFTGDTSGVINDDNGIGFSILFWLAAGDSFTSGSTSATFQTYANADSAAGHAVNLLDDVANEWFITGIQLEIGQNATEFEHESFSTTLHKCERYFQKWDLETAVGTGLWFSANQVLGHLELRQIMCNEPTMSVSSADFVKGYLAAGASDANDSGSPFDLITPQAARFNTAMVASGTNGQGCLLQLKSSEYIYADAEVGT